MRYSIKVDQTVMQFRLELAQLIFTNEEKKIYDCSPLLDFGIFQELKNKQYFNQVKILDGTVTWPNEQDICPDTLYLDSISQT
ncbi:MAG: DUF2442 domain-containing protein [Microcystis sp. M048S1]|nr:DUF2442 domain-containing protein [Microcystis sp. M176S2]MCA2726969.1 DUF2442 domain-containing protein [Microcystis sp. M166S2]MCA2728660.1 DUF2442 domain-containing protein [Microcystis sp. M162S2]MCA2748987.1 DUF2442 domain-containing protein [Microcystis sp. M155S2]MCA2767549.1 DUF2442 domain-containing protein [Microcystis sp. M152S2]MCA2777237.1 DUF2442 domain-containing protein [Microcystis sp. M135S2]MCA2780915.1 DUF2442 domain-containing protein [Microcystis sp. M136S2]MCA278353